MAKWGAVLGSVLLLSWTPVLLVQADGLTSSLEALEALVRAQAHAIGAPDDACASASVSSPLKAMVQAQAAAPGAVAQLDLLLDPLVPLRRCGPGGARAANASVRAVTPAGLRHVLTAAPADAYTLVLLYARWCPFSRAAVAPFVLLSALQPCVRALVVDGATNALAGRAPPGLPALILYSGATAISRYGEPASFAAYSGFLAGAAQRAVGHGRATPASLDRMNAEDTAQVLLRIAAAGAAAGRTDVMRRAWGNYRFLLSGAPLPSWEGTSPAESLALAAAAIFLMVAALRAVRGVSFLWGMSLPDDGQA